MLSPRNCSWGDHIVSGGKDLVRCAGPARFGRATVATAPRTKTGAPRATALPAEDEHPLLAHAADFGRRRGIGIEQDVMQMLLLLLAGGAQLGQGGRGPVAVERLCTQDFERL